VASGLLTRLRRVAVRRLRVSPTAYHSGKTLQAGAHAIRRTWWRTRRLHVIRRYLARPGTKRLELGTGEMPAAGWLSSDVDPRRSVEGDRTARRPVIYLDATKRFPFPDDVFDYVRSEHMIEHLPHESARLMLRECARVLRPSGRIRIATPDLDRLVDLYRNRRAQRPEESAYIRWVAASLMGDPARAQPIFVLNNAFRAWGHMFLYDEELLRSMLSDAGFADIRRYEVGESDDGELVRGERHGQIVENEAASRFETLVLEATKPNPASARYVAPPNRSGPTG
jgi:predicted SAM-dependent methyltransferase